MSRKIIITIVLELLLITSAIGCNRNVKVQETVKPLDKVTIVLDREPNTNHTGIYVAKDKNFFKDENLDVTIIYPWQNTSDQLVSSGKAQFGISSQDDVTFDRLKNSDLISIAAVLQQNTLALAAPASKNIKDIKGFEGKKYLCLGLSSEESILKTLLNNHQGSFSLTTIMPPSKYNFFDATERYADFSLIYYGWDGIASKIKGRPIDYFLLRDEDMSLNFYSPVVVATEKYINNNEDIVKRFLKALSKGYDYASKNPDDSASILLRNVPGLDKPLVEESQRWLSSRYKGDAKYWGQQKPEVWENFARWLYDNKAIDKFPDWEVAYTNDFLPEEQRQD